MVLYRPVGTEELRLIEEIGYREFPPRLPEQPIFYPVLHEDYAREIALKENCYKLMLLTGSKQESRLNFYRKAGYNSEDKAAFIQWI